MKTLPEKRFIEDLQPGKKVESTFALAMVSLREYTGGRFLQMKLADRTGKIHAVLWTAAEAVYAKVKAGDIVYVKGKVEMYRDRPQVQIQYLAPVEDTSAMDLSDYVRIGSVDTQAIWQELTEIGAQVTNPFLSSLLAQFFSDEQLREGFLRAPGGKQWHHAWIGGLATHTLAVVKNCQVLADLYPRADRDLLIVGAIMHDLGKVEELASDTTLDYTDVGRLVGHQILSYQIASRYIEQIQGFPKDLALKLQHLILAHHGEAEDAIRRPMVYEAVILSRADDLDAQLDAFGRELDRAKENQRPWSDYVNLINRYLFRGNDDSNDVMSDQVSEEDASAVEQVPAEELAVPEEPSEDLLF